MFPSHAEKTQRQVIMFATVFSNYTASKQADIKKTQTQKGFVNESAGHRQLSLTEGEGGKNHHHARLAGLLLYFVTKTKLEKKCVFALSLCTNHCF